MQTMAGFAFGQQSMWCLRKELGNRSLADSNENSEHSCRSA